MRFVRRVALWLVALLRFLTGAALTQSFPTALLLAGWGQEVSRRAALVRWAKLDGLAAPENCQGWPTFILGGFEHDSLAAAIEFPLPASAEDGGEVKDAVASPPEARLGVVARFKTVSRRLLGGAWRNVVAGMRVLLCTYLITGPAMALWTFSWRYGWDNSFNKGYEQAYIGPALGLSGVLLFMLAMFYVPLAQTQLALSGRLSSFFNWRAVGTIIRTHPRGVVALAAVYFLAALPVNLLLVGVLFRFNEGVDWQPMTDAEVLTQLKRYFFITGMVGLPLFAWTRVVAGRVYACGARSALASGALTVDKLPDELSTAPLTSPPAPERAIRLWGRRLGLTPLLLAALIVWFGFVAQIYIRQFLNYVPVQGWLNQPLVHVPLLRYIPPHLKAGANPAGVQERGAEPHYKGQH